jgi:two-component system, cell cycle response regulator
MIGGRGITQMGVDEVEPATATSRQSASPAVLLAEDDPVQRLKLGHVLALAGYVTESVRDGQVALDRMATGRFQMLVTDWDMPGVDGPSLCQRVRALALPHYTYIVLLTSHDRTEDAVRALEAGADDYVRKPVHPTELVARLNAGRRIIELEQSLREAKSQIEQLSLTDPLTGVYNRRFVDRRLPVEVDDARRHHSSLSVIMADLDRFKQINDTHGHPVGDEILVGFSRRASALLRSADWMARLGGEEFLFVLPVCGAGAAEQVAERVRGSVAERPFATSIGELTVTVSLGVVGVEVDRDAPTQQVLEKLLREADNALYASKQRGRNRVTCFQADARVGHAH